MGANKRMSPILLPLILIISLVNLGCSDNDSIKITKILNNPTEDHVNIVIYTDLACTTCANFHYKVENPLHERYAINGIVDLKIIILAGANTNSLQAAEAALAANYQGQLWKFRTTLLDSWEVSKRPDYSVAHLRSIAQEIGLDMDLFDNYVTSSSVLDQLVSNNKCAELDKVDRLPLVFINEQRIEGLHNLDFYTDIIDTELTILSP